MGVEVVLILLFIFLLVVLLAITINKFNTKDNKVNSDYDERQERVRGTGFKYGFFTLMICNALYGYSEKIFARKIFDTFTGIAIGIFISSMVHVCYCIWNDGYFSMSSNHKRTLLLFLVLGVFNLVIGLMSLIHGEVIVDGIITYHSCNLMIALMMFVIFFVLWLKNRLQTDEEQ